MSKTVTATEAKNNLGALMKWAKQNRGGVYVKQYGEPAVVILGVDEFEEMRLNAERQRRRKLIEEIEKIKQEAWDALPDDLKEIDAVQMYIEAGFSDEIARETAEFDEQLKQMRR